MTIAAVRSTRCDKATGSEIQRLKSAARTILWNCGIDITPRRIDTLVLDFVHRVERNGFAFFDFLANTVQLDAEQRRAALANPDIARAIAYADPTGEAAVAHVTRERGF